jgi:TM2 domain-containing membrane protein YozV
LAVRASYLRKSEKMADPTEMMLLQQSQQIPENRRAEFMMAYQSQKKDRTVALVLSLFLGTLGIDRFFTGQTGLGVAKLLTLGGCGLWTIIDWFLIMGAVDQYNRGVLQRVLMMFPPASPGGFYGQPPGSGPYGGPPGGYGPPPQGGYGGPSGYGPPR